MKREIGLNELRKTQIEILNVVADYCDRKGLNYWLDSGTLLGAIRHRGYIPWDDDIDIGMLREDYNTFLNEFNQSNTRYQVHSIENDPCFLHAFAKILDTKTILYEPDERGLKLSINIDLFAYDNSPDSKIKTRYMFLKRDFYRFLYVLQLYNSEPRGNKLRRLTVKVASKIAKLLPENYFVKLVASNARRCEQKSTKCVGNFLGHTNMTCEKSVFSSFITVEFEGNRYNAMSGFDLWLREYYGDYMKLPPENERISHHVFKAYLLEE